MEKNAIDRVPERVPMDRFENAIREIGVEAACEWFGHSYDSEFTKESIRILNERLAATNAQEESQ